MNSKLAIVILSLLAFACSESKIKPDTARQILARELNLPEEAIEVHTTSGSGNAIVADASLRISFLLEPNGKQGWKISKVRQSSGVWIPPEEFLNISSLNRALHSAFLAELAR